MATLTDRQKEINGLLSKGKTPGEIAKKLKITENGVYQHMRRIRAATGAKPKAASGSRSRSSSSNSRSRSRASGGSRSTAKRTTAKRTTTKRPAAARRPSPVASTPAPASPLDAIRARRDEIAAMLVEVRAEEKRLTDELATATAAREKAEGSVAEELTRLAQSEAILTGKALPKAADKSRTRSGSKPAKAATNGKGAEAAPPAADAAVEGEGEAQAPANGPGGAATLAAHLTGTTPEGAADAERAEAEAAQAAAEASDEPTPVGALVGEERPGVETVPEFAQEDGFAGEAS